MLKILALFVFSKVKVMTGYHDYLIVLSPSISVIGRVKQLKDFTAGVIGDYDSRHSKAHITIQPLMRKKPEWIEPLIPKLERDLQNMPPIIMDINGYNYFDHPERPTIYANLQSDSFTKVWFKQLRKYFSTPEFVPHITVARSIATDDFRKLWPRFKTFEWTEKFKVDKLTILRRETFGHDRSYKVFKEIPFNSRIDFFEFANSKLTPHRMPLNRMPNLQFNLF